MELPRADRGAGSRLLAVLRRPEIICALISEPRGLSPAGDGLLDPYFDRVLPLASTPEQLCPWRDRDANAWRALARVPDLGRRPVQAIVRILIASVVDPDVSIDSPRPPTFGRGPVDLRPHLCHPDGERWLLAQIREALPRTGEVELADWHWHRRDDLAALPAGFRRHFLWGLALSSWLQVELTRAAYDALALESDLQCRRAVARLLSIADREVGLWWCDALAELPGGLRARAAATVLGRGIHRQRPDPEMRRALARGELGPLAS